MRTMQRLLLCLIFLAPSLHAETWRVDTTRLNAWAQDSTGLAWGIGVLMGTDLYRWDGSGWNTVTVNGIPGNYRALALTSGPDGDVYCLWSTGEGDQAVTRHKASSSSVVARFTGQLDRFFPSIFVDPNHNIWITESGIHIYRITPDGKAECAYTIEYDHRVETNLPKNSRLNFDSVYAAADGLGRVWFWSGRRGGGRGVPSLQGILIFDGTNFTLHTDLPDPSITSYSTVEPDGADHMLLGGPRGHLYTVDIHNFAIQPVPEPELNTFRYVQSISHAGQATYIVAVNGSAPVAERSGEGRIGVLWRLQNGEWTRLLNGIDMRPQILNDSARSFLATPAGVWLGAFGTGPWFIPAGSGEPVHIDWKYGYSLDESEGLMALHDGRLLIIAATSGSMACGTIAANPAELLAAHQSPSGVQTLNPLRALVSDHRDHLWGFLAGKEHVISEWDGKTWTDHALPEDFDPLRAWNFGFDTQNRVWLLSGPCRGPVTVLNPERGGMEVYQDFAYALQAQLPNRANFHIEGNHFTVSTMTPDGRIGYRDPCWQAHYFDGQTWRMWKTEEIDAGPHRNFDGPAFFDHAGNFAVNISGRTWEYLKSDGWHAVSFERGFGTDQERSAPQSPSPPPGCEAVIPESVVADRLGTFWLTSHGQLYRAIPGLCTPQFSPGQTQPFVDSRTIRSVTIDPAGNAFFETYLASHSDIGEYVILNARPPLPHTTLRAAADTSGIVSLHFSTPAQGKVRFTWRVDGGDWSSPSESSEARIDGLPDGAHRIEAAAMDDRLQIESTPAATEVTVHVDTGKQLATLIEQLKDPDYSVRNAAVQALARQPEKALPLLQSAREKAGPDEQWWIDAAIQQIQQKLAGKEKP